MAKSERLTIDKLNMEGCINLLEALLADLSEEYMTTYKRLVDNPFSESFREHYTYLREYIQSTFFSELTGLDGNEVISTLEYRCAKGG